MAATCRTIILPFRGESATDPACGYPNISIPRAILSGKGFSSKA